MKKFVEIRLDTGYVLRPDYERWEANSFGVIVKERLDVDDVTLYPWHRISKITEWER